jgi:hypothetical protein
LSNASYTETKLLKQITPSGVAVYLDKVMIFSYGVNDSACIVIKCKGTADSFKQFFDSLWAVATK